MITVNKFENSALAGADLLDALLDIAKPRVSRGDLPSLLELLTICRETGSRLLELDIYAASRDRDPVFVLCGGDRKLAQDVADKLGLDASFTDHTELPLIWWVYGGGKPSTRIRIGLTERALSQNALANLLDGDVPKDKHTLIYERTRDTKGWGMIWITRPDLMDNILLEAAGLDVLFTQQAALCVNLPGDLPLIMTLREMGQKLWEISDSILNHQEARERLISEIAEILKESSDEKNVRAAALWDWLVPRLIESIERHQLRYQTEIDRQARKIQIARQTLTEYRRNWVSNMHNSVEAYLHKKISGKSFVPFYDAKKNGPEAATYLSAIGLSGLWLKLRDSMTDRMAEFVAGLSALATKIELRQISLQDVDTRWNPSRTSGALEPLLNSNQVFSARGGAKLGIVGSLVGKSDEILEARKSEIARANRLISQTIVQDFTEWCEALMAAVERQIKLQLAARLVNEGLPDTDSLKTAIAGLDRLAGILKGRPDVVRRTPETLTAEWLESFSHRHWIPSYSNN